MPNSRLMTYRYDEEEIKYSDGQSIKVRIKREYASADYGVLSGKDSKEHGTGKVVDLEIYLDSKQHTDFLKHFVHNQRGISNETLCYTGIFQHNLSRFFYSKIGEKDPPYQSRSQESSNWFEQVFFYLLDIFQKGWDRLANFVNKSIGFSEEQENEVTSLMETLRLCSTRFADLEELINHPPDDDVYKVIDHLKGTVKTVCQNIRTDLEQYRDGLIDDSVRNVINTLIEKLKIAEQTFLANLDEQKKIQQSENPLSLIFNMQDRSSGTASLGSFIAGQTISLCAGGIDEIYRIGGGRGSQLLHTHPAIKYLSDVKSELNARGRSLHGVAHNNGRSPYSRGMIDALRTSVSPEGQNGAWIRITDYVENGLGDWDEIDKILCHITKQPVNAKRTHKYAFFLKLGLFISSVVELFVYTPLHLLVTLFSFVVNSVCYLLPFVVLTGLYAICSILADVIVTGVNFFSMSLEQTFDQWRNRMSVSWGHVNSWFQQSTFLQSIDHAAEILHHKLSCVKWYKNKLEDGYKRDELSPHKDVIDKLKGHAFSLYNQLLSRFSGYQLVKYIADFLTQTIDSVTGFIRDLSFLMQPKSAKKRQRAFDEQCQQVQALMEQVVRHFIAESKHEAGHVHSSLNDSSSFTADDKKEGYWPLIVPQPVNSVPSVLIVPEELVIGFFKRLTDPAFRNNGLSATALFAVSCLTLGALAVPGTIKMAGLRNTSIYLSKLFGQNIANHSLPHEIIGVTLQWQVSYASYEGIKSLLRGKTELIEWIFNNSEKIVLGLTLAAGAGKLLQYIPPVPESGLPNIVGAIQQVTNHVAFAKPLGTVLSSLQSYAFGFISGFPKVLNKFIEESGDVELHGTHPFKDCEQAVFGIKFLVILHSLVTTGEHGSHSEAHLVEIREKIDLLEERMRNKEENKKEELLQVFLTQSFPILNDIYKQIVSKIQSETNPKAKQEAKQEDPLEKAWRELHEAIVVNEQYDELRTLHHAAHPAGLSNDLFSNRTRSALNFDYVTEKFNRYREELKARNLPHQYLDDYEDNYLHSLYNKNCYEKTTTLVRLLTLALFYVPTLLFRGFKYYMAGTELFYSPAVRQQIKMEFASDKALFLELGGLLAWIAKGTIRPVGYMLRSLVVIPMVLGSAIGIFFCDYSKIKSFNKACLEFVAGFTPHRLDLTSWLRPVYARISREAGTNSDDHHNNARRLLEKLKKDKVARSDAAAQKRKENFSSASLISQLATYERQVKIRWLSPNSARAQQVKVLSAIANDTKKSHQEKEEYVKDLHDSLPKGSELKEAIQNAGFFNKKEKHPGLSERTLLRRQR